MRKDFEKSGLLESLEQRQLYAVAGFNDYLVTNLVTDGTEPAVHKDKNLVNPWGIVVGSLGLRVADNGTGVSTRYMGNGVSSDTPISIPAGAGSEDGSSAPTGIVYNIDPTGFIIHKGNKSAPAVFITVGEDGGIVGVNKLVSSKGVLAEDSSDEGAIYKGVAMAKSHGKYYLYAADFHNKSINVYDDQFKDADLKGHFKDPNLPSQYAPFNIQLLDGQLYVAYAKTQPGSNDELAGAGLGFVDVFNTDGTFARRLATKGVLNAPWGLAKAPNNWGKFGGDILVGNFGDGWINAFSKDGTFQGTLMQYGNYYPGTALVYPGESPIAIDGLWGLAFGDGRNGTDKNALYFTAGSNDEAGGLLGKITVDTNYYITGQPGASATSKVTHAISLIDT